MASDQYNETNEFSHWEPKSYLDGHPLDQPGHYEEALKVYPLIFLPIFCKGEHCEI
jgi:hypothetical protein